LYSFLCKETVVLHCVQIVTLFPEHNTNQCVVMLFVDAVVL